MQTDEQTRQGVPLRPFKYGQKIRTADEDQRSDFVERRWAWRSLPARVRASTASGRLRALGRQR